MIRSAFPDNIVLAAANMNVLGVITVALLFGAALATMGPQVELGWWVCDQGVRIGVGV